MTICVSCATAYCDGKLGRSELIKHRDELLMAKGLNPQARVRTKVGAGANDSASDGEAHAQVDAKVVKQPPAKKSKTTIDKTEIKFGDQVVPSFASSSTGGSSGSSQGSGSSGASQGGRVQAHEGRRHQNKPAQASQKEPELAQQNQASNARSSQDAPSRPHVFLRSQIGWSVKFTIHRKPL